MADCYDKQGKLAWGSFKAAEMLSRDVGGGGLVNGATAIGTYGSTFLARLHTP